MILLTRTEKSSPLVIADQTALYMQLAVSSPPRIGVVWQAADASTRRHVCLHWERYARRGDNWLRFHGWGIVMYMIFWGIHFGKVECLEINPSVIVVWIGSLT